MRILLIGSYKYEMYAPAFSSGFKQLGHEVIEIDYERFHLNGGGFIASFLNRFQDRYHYGLMMHKYNKAIIDAVEKEKPNFVFFYRCYHVWPKTMKRLKGKSFFISYNNDDPFSRKPSQSFYRYHLKCAKFCDVNYVYRRKNIEDYAHVDINNCRILLPYYLSKQNFPIICEKDIPIAFIGHYENDGRDFTIKKMIDAGLPIRVYGREYRWRESSIYDQISSVLYDGVRGAEYNQTINRCKIALVFLSKRNSDNYTRRCFEIPAASSLMMAPFTNDLNDLFKDGEDAVYYNDISELIDKCKYYLEHENELNMIAKHGHDRLDVIGGNEIDRCKEVIGYVEKQ